MARFTLQNGMVLEIHIPGVARIETSESPTRTAGFTLRNGEDLVNVGVLSMLFPTPPAPPRSSSTRRPRRARPK